MEARQLMVADIESSGLEQGVDEILEIGFLWVNLIPTKSPLGTITFSYEVLDKFQSFVRPNNPSRLKDEVLNINRINREEILNAPTSIEVKAHFSEWWESLGVGFAEVLGHNFGGFDKGFLQIFFGNMYKNMFNYKDEDTYTLAKACQMLGLISEDNPCKLETLSLEFGLIHRTHTAIDDCFATIQSYVALLNLLSKGSIK